MTRKAETEALLVELFGDPWKPAYNEFMRKIRRLREEGRAAIPLLALDMEVRGLDPLSAALVAREVLAYRKGYRKPTATELVRQMMRKHAKRIR